MIAIKIILLVMAVFLVVAVLLQEGKSEGLAAIGGGSSDSYLGKGKGKGVKKSEMFSKITTIVAIIFVIVVVLLGIFDRRNPNHQEVPLPTETFEDPSYVKTPAPKTTTPKATATKAPATTTAPATTAVSTAE